jgi:hypothetical protein
LTRRKPFRLRRHHRPSRSFTYLFTRTATSTRRSSKLEFGAYGLLLHTFGKVNVVKPQTKNNIMAVAAAQKSREMFAINKSYSIEVINAVSRFIFMYFSFISLYLFVYFLPPIGTLIQQVSAFPCTPCEINTIIHYFGVCHVANMLVICSQLWFLTIIKYPRKTSTLFQKHAISIIFDKKRKTFKKSNNTTISHILQVLLVDS